jgi:DNA-binding NtrC family response regulator
MHNLHVLIHQTRAFHQIRLHQAFNAQGAYNIRLSDDIADVIRGLECGLSLDLLVLDHRMPRDEALSLFARLSCAPLVRALLFVGQAQAGASLAHEARRHGLWVLVDVPWARLAVALGRALDCLAVGRQGRLSKLSC